MRISDWSSDVCSSDLAGRSSSVRRNEQDDGGPGCTHFQRHPSPHSNVLRRRLVEKAEQSELLCKSLFAGSSVDKRHHTGDRHARTIQSEKRRVGKEGDRTDSCRWSRYYKKKKN